MLFFSEIKISYSAAATVFFFCPVGGGEEQKARLDLSWCRVTEESEHNKK